MFPLICTIMISMRKAFVIVWLILICSAYAGLNIFASQFVYSPLMFRLLSFNDVDTARQYLANLEGSALYDSQSRYLNGIFDNIFAREVDVAQLNTRKTIDKYERLLSFNTHNRDVLVKLSLLYKDIGNRDKALAYYKQAQEIDPWVRVVALERL